VRWNAAFAYLDPARDRPNLTVLADTLADRIDLEATCLLTSRGSLRANTIVLASGAYGSPGILLRSGVGPGLVHDLPVGEGLVDHVGVGLGWEATAALQAETASFAKEHELFMAQVTLPLDDHDLFVFPAVEPGYEISAAVFAMKPESRGRISLLSPDPLEPLRVEHGFLTEERDVDVLASGVDRVRELAEAEPLRRYARREARPGKSVSAVTHVRSGARGFFHPVGTCSMGTVVEPNGRLIGVDGVVVVDASIMPTIPRANTNLSVIAIAERLSELI
jgi:choline dehydrogenase